MQGLEMRHGWIPVVVRAMLQQVQLGDAGLQLIDRSLYLVMVGVMAESGLVHTGIGTWGYTVAFIG